MDFFTTLKLGWLNAWIPAVLMVVVQFLFMAIFKEGGKRAVDTSWYDAKTKHYAVWNTVFQILLILIAIFIPFKIGTVWFFTGGIVYVAAFALFIWSFFSYASADMDKLITNGIYKYSRNPMYAVFTLAMIGICIATASLWLLLVLIPYVWAMHGTILGEEKYCETTYSDAFREYKKHVPRYFLFF